MKKYLTQISKDFILGLVTLLIPVSLLAIVFAIICLALKYTYLQSIYIAIAFFYVCVKIGEHKRNLDRDW